MERVVVTGMGIISALGSGVDENLDSLRNARSGIEKAHFFESKYTESLVFGEVKKSTAQLREELAVAPAETGLTRTTLLAIHAFQEAITDAGLSPEALSALDTAFISASTVGGMCHTDELYADANLRGTVSAYVRSYEGADHTRRIARIYQVKGITDTINTACSSSANAILLGMRLIRSGRVKRVIAGGADSLAKYTVNGFNSLRILSEAPCRPFDERRDGLNLGEGAAYLVLEGLADCSGKRIYAELTGYGNSNDAFHPSATSDEAVGPVKAMNDALRMAAINASEIRYINAHGTGTPNNDQTELHAFEQVFDRIPFYNATKSYTGHTLGAAGAIEAVFSIFSLLHGEVYPSLRCDQPIGPTAPVTTTQALPIDAVLSNSFGFGGNCTSLIFQSIR